MMLYKQDFINMSPQTHIKKNSIQQNKKLMRKKNK